ncbi:MAG: ABC transporter substrate-binding protein [Roseburia sp.]|nr:ABC transporter substrate-binding protein [Roseburia sp.]
MKKAGRFLSVMMAAAMTMSLAACGGNTNNDASGSNNVDSGSQAENSSEDANTDGGSESSEAANANHTDGGAAFKIGGIGPITGGAAIYGSNVMNAASIAIDEINAAGGVNGYKLELNFQDDEHDAEKAINAYNVVKDWGAQILVGTVTSGPCIAVSEKTMADNMFMLTPSGSAVECVQYDNAYRVCFSDPGQGAASARYINDNNLATKVAVIYDSSTIYSSGIYESFLAGAEDANFEIVAAEAFTADNNTDFSVQLQKAKDAGADLVFLPIYYQESSLILTQAAGMDFNPIWFSCDGMDGILSMEGFNTDLAEGVMLLTPFAADASDDLTVNFVTKYKENYNDVPNQFAADAYDAVYIIKALIEKTGVTPDMSASDICEKFCAAILELQIDGLTGEAMTWSADGEVNKAPKAVRIENGSYVSME